VPIRFEISAFSSRERSETSAKCFQAREPGTDVMILNIFSPKNLAKKLAFLTQNKAKLCKILIITLVWGKNAIFFAENCRKSQKIVIITSTPGLSDGYFQTKNRNLGTMEDIGIFFSPSDKYGHLV
jgi:hypothetical protein